MVVSHLIFVQWQLFIIFRHQTKQKTFSVNFIMGLNDKLVTYLLLLSLFCLFILSMSDMYCMLRLMFFSTQREPARYLKGNN